jgi:hypothetical protein
MAAIGTRLLTLTIAGTDATAEVSTCKIVSAASSSDFVSFADAAAGGGREYALALAFVQDGAAGALWDQVWSHAGETVAFAVNPYGNAVASATQPHFTGSAIISEPDGSLLGGDADPSPTNRFITEVEWKCVGKPLRVIA